MGIFYFKNLGNGSFWFGTLPPVAIGLFAIFFLVFSIIPDALQNPKNYTCNTTAFNETPTCDKKDWMENYNSGSWYEEFGSAKIDENGLLTLTQTETYLNDPYSRSAIGTVDALYSLPYPDMLDFEFIKEIKMTVTFGDILLASGEWDVSDVLKLDSSWGGDLGVEDIVRNLYIAPQLNCSIPTCENQR
jgi:hypothetical protein